MSYELAPATGMLATHCCACGRPLLDATSVELGIGPVCRDKYGFGSPIDESARQEANQLVAWAAIWAQEGATAKVIAIADQIESLGLNVLAGKIRERFVTIRLEEKDGWIGVFTPYVEGFARTFHRCVPDTGRNAAGEEIKVKAKCLHKEGRRKGKFKCYAVRRGWARGVLKALATTWPGQYAVGPKGVFKIPDLDEYRASYERAES